MFEEIEKRVAKIMYEWRLSCLAGDEVQSAYCRGMLTEVLFSMKSAEQSVQLTGGILRGLEADTTPEDLSGLEVDSTPPTSN